MRHTKHYWRAAFLILLGLIAFFSFRALLIPESFGKFGYYRGDNVEEQMSLPVSFSKNEACADCHEVAAIHESGKHKTVQCQNCHAPLAVHVVEGEMVELMPIDRSPKLCLRCHRKLPSRPQDFPQIVAQDHTGEFEQNLKSGACLECHQPHSPSL